jgi:hypothetical protein
VGHSAYDIAGLIHQDGWKLDVGHNTCLDSYIENINSFSGFYQISNRPGDGAKQWWDSATGAIYALEGTHWDIVFPPQPANIPVNLAISYDPTNPSGGGIYGINDDYTYSFNCAQDDSLCSTVQGQLNTVIGLFNAANGPQGSSSVGVTNAFNKINVTYYPNTPADVSADEGSLAHAVFNPSQGVGTCQINIYGANLQNIANQYATPDVADSSTVTNLIAGAIQQQMFTCFGVADENFTGSDASNNNDSYVTGPSVNVGQAQFGAIPLKNDPTNISKLLQAIKNKTPIQVNNCVPINSAKHCSNGQTYSLSQHKCVPNTVASNTNTHPPMSGYDCTCDIDENPSCTNGQNVITDPETIAEDFDFSCSVPTGVTCECFNGEPLGCTDTNGKPVATPDNYQCEQPPN